MLIALTGGIATGKTTFRKFLGERFSFEIFDADACVHSLLSSDPEIVSAIAKTFGDGVISEAGQVTRAALRPLVFSDSQARRRLEAVLHPAVRSRWLEQSQACRASGKDFLADIPLLFETSGHDHFDATVVVAASA